MDINFQNAEFITSWFGNSQLKLEKRPEVLFAGRSNVGKSSMINKIFNRKALAKTSQKPGKTATVNFYSIDKCLNLVDLPGYGFAKVSKEEKKKWGTIIETYLNSRVNLSQVVLLVDSRHTPTADDRVMMGFIREVCPRAVVIATKCDKLKKSEVEDRMYDIIKTLRLEGDDIIIPFSAVNGTGVEEFWCYVEEIIMNNAEETEDTDE